MKNNRLLKVTPLVKAYRPKYPSFSDPNPLDHPESRPYPFTLKMLHRLSAAGFLGTVMFSCGVQAPNYKGASDSKTSQDSLINPFPISATNLPYQPAMFGTGLPSRLSSREVVEVLNEAFTAEGLHVVKDTSIKIGDQFIPVSAYSPETKIGYILMNSSNHGDGMIKGKYGVEESNSVKTRKKDLKFQIERSIKSYNSDPIKFLSWQAGKDEYAASIKTELKLNLPLQGSEKKQQKYLKKKVTEYVLQSRINRVINNEQDNVRIKWERSAVTHQNDKEDVYVTLSRIGSACNLHSFKPDQLNKLEEVVLRIDKATNRKAWLKHSNALIELLEVGNTNRIRGNTKYRELLIDIVSNPDYTTWEERCHEIRELVDIVQLSYEELESIADNCDKEYHIAPFSIRDDRTVYRMDYQYDNEEMSALMKKARAETDMTKKAKLNAELAALRVVANSEMDKRRNEAIRAQSLRLQEDMKGYIRWAKSQIGY